MSSSKRQGRTSVFAGLAVALALVLAACQKQGEQQAQPTAPVGQESPHAQEQAAPGMPNEAAAPELKDTFESSSSYIFGVTYAPGINKYPGLARHIQSYVQAARADTEVATGAGASAGPGNAPHELSLTFSQIVETPELVVIAADGNRYTGGAHGEPLVERYVWLPRQDRLLDAKSLIPDAAGWQAVSAAVRESLRTAVSVRADAESLPPDQRELMVRQAGKMIDEGTAPDPANFSRFVPVLDPSGKISALRFVFPPYQVGPYAEGTQQAEVAASALLPHVAPAYRGLFAGGAAAQAS
jgi:hypothetical protein